MKTIFVGGIHGVGKTTACLDAKVEYGFELYQASDLLQRGKKLVSSSVSQNSSFEENQKIILSYFLYLRGRKDNLNVVVDGHFALYDICGSIRTVSSDLFKRMKVDHFICIYDEVDSIWERLQMRDGNALSREKLGALQRVEVENAKKVSRDCNVSISCINAKKIDDFFRIIGALLA